MQRKVAFVIALIALSFLSGCRGYSEAASMKERESMEASLSLLAAQDMGGMRNYRKGFLYIEPT